MNAVTAIGSRTAQLQGLIDSVSPARAQPATSTQVGTAAATTFSDTLDRAVNGTTGASPAVNTTSPLASVSTTGSAGTGGLSVAGMSVPDFRNAQVPAGTGLDFLQRAMEHLGTPYVWGGATPSGFDCSGLIQYVFNEMGVSVPRVARDQMRAGTEVPSLAQAQPGDLVVTRGGGHIGIYVGGDQMLHAPRPGENVKIGKIYGEIATIRRVVPTGTLTPVADGGATAGASGVGAAAALASSLAGTSALGALGALGVGGSGSGVDVSADRAVLALAGLRP